MKKKIIIENLDHFGRGVVHIDNIPVFVDGALSDEEVEIEITKTKKNYMEGIVTKRIKDSIDRVKPLCPYYDECGGCDLMHIPYNKQLEFKENKIKEILKKFANIENINKIISTKQYNYRNKITLQVNEKIGLYKKKSYDLVAIDECLITDNKINNIIKRLKKIDLKNIKQIVIRATNEVMLIFYIKDKINEKEIINSFNDLDSIVVIDDKEKVIHGKKYIEEDINNYRFIISPQSFFQVNFDGMQKLYNKAIEYANINNDNVLDLYCGTGTIGIYASIYAKKVLGIEINQSAIKDAFINKEINNINNIDFKVGDVKDLVDKINFKPDIIFVDPPRSGLDSKTTQYLLNIKANKIIYISCNPVTLARDLNILKNKYDVIEVTPVDMFPNTYHVECVVLLQYKKD